jgi:hypothetical protein
MKTEFEIRNELWELRTMIGKFDADSVAHAEHETAIAWLEWVLGE